MLLLRVVSCRRCLAFVGCRARSCFASRLCSAFCVFLVVVCCLLVFVVVVDGVAVCRCISCDVVVVYVDVACY